jgi:hypothetical protein
MELLCVLLGLAFIGALMFCLSLYDSLRHMTIERDYLLRVAEIQQERGDRILAERNNLLSAAAEQKRYWLWWQMRERRHLGAWRVWR